MATYGYTNDGADLNPFGESATRDPARAILLAAPDPLQQEDQDLTAERQRRMLLGQEEPLPGRLSEPRGIDLVPSRSTHYTGTPAGIRPAVSPGSALPDLGVLDWYVGTANDWPFSDDADSFDFFGGFRSGDASRVMIQLRGLTDIPEKIRTDIFSVSMTQDMTPFLSVTLGVFATGNLGGEDMQNAAHSAFHLGPRFHLRYPPTAVDVLVGIDGHYSPVDGWVLGFGVTSALRELTEIQTYTGTGTWIGDWTYASLVAGYRFEIFPTAGSVLSSILSSGPFVGGRIYFGGWGLGVDVYRITNGPNMDGLGKIAPNVQIRLSVFEGSF